MTNEPAPLPAPVLMRCSRCHSPNVMRDAWAVWNAATQEWELGPIFDHSACDDCGAEECIEEIEVAGQQILPGTPSLESVVGAMERGSALQVADMMAEPTPEGIERAKAILAAEAAAHADPITPTEASDQGGADESE